MDDTLMGIGEARRLGEVEAALRGEISNREGARRTGLSLRQFKRLRARMRKHGARGLVHGNRGRPSPQRIAERIREKVVALLQHPEVCVNDCHIRDLLALEELVVSADTVRRLRRRLGLPAKQRRRPKRHHRRRERVAELERLDQRQLGVKGHGTNGSLGGGAGQWKRRRARQLMIGPRPHGRLTRPGGQPALAPPVHYP